GAVRMLQECAFQFDVVDTQSDFAKYRLLILPDQIPVDPLFADKLSIYMENGGKAIFTCKSGLTPDEASFALDIGVTKREEQPVDVYGEDVVGKIYDRGDYCQYILPGDVIGKDLPKDYHVMYARGVDVDAKEGANVLVNAYASV
ncbi:beta-galactosidase, partial [Romboutsia ilealis]|nr:beta-galactosidase [Romboutsia ilealis]